MNKAFLAISAVCALTGSAGMAGGVAYGQATAAATLKMRIVPVDVTQADPLNLSFQSDEVHNAVLPTDTGSARVRRFSVQYQIEEAAGYEGVIASLGAVPFDITSSVTGGTVSSLVFRRATLTRAQGSNANISTGLDSWDPASAIDATGNSTGAYAGVAGLHRVWRHGSLSDATAGGNNLPANGTVMADGIRSVLPITLSPVNQSPVEYPGAWFGIYDFTVTVGDASPGSDVIVKLSLRMQPDSQTGNVWAAYEDGSGIVQTSRRFAVTGAAFRVIPAPGAIAAAGIGVVIALSRRRR